MDFQIRQAAPEDAEAVVRMHTLVHEECYRAPAVTRILSRPAGQHSRACRTASTIPGRPDPRIIALDANSEVVGLADAGPGRDEDAPV